MAAATEHQNAHLLDPPLPFDMKPRADRATGDLKLQQFVGTATHGKDRGRVAALARAFGAKHDAARDLAGRIRQHALDNLDVYLERWADRAAARGTQVHFATDAAQANAVCIEIAQRHGCRLCVKSKSMVTEETRLVPALQRAGVETVETDLGEFIVQLDNDAPSHIVTPMIHKDRTAVARAFERELGAAYTEDPESLTMIAREHLREKYRRADLGVSGANFLVAETGALVLCSNEGNIDLCVSGPRVHVALVGIEKVIPRTEDLAVFLKLLARSSTAQDLTVYTTIISGPRRPDEHDGPEEVHVILLDNGRTEILAEETRELLRCIRCGACLNACPVFRKVGGGHAYGAVYSGPIGAVITPLFKGVHNYPDLPKASSLCGACYEACPVKIDIPKHLVRLRRQMVDRRVTGRAARLAYRAWAVSLKSAWSYRASLFLSRLALRALGRPGRGGNPFADRKWTARLPGPLAGWTAARDFPTPTTSSFRAWWRKERRP